MTPKRRADLLREAELQGDGGMMCIEGSDVKELLQLEEALVATRAYDYHRWNCLIGEDNACRACFDLKARVCELRGQVLPD